MDEIWKDVQGYEGLYQVSNMGRVRSITRYVRHAKGGFRVSPSKIMKLCQNGDGYYFVGLHRDNKVKPFRVNRLVAEAFIPNPDNLPCVNHIDKNRLNNNVNNLEWCTVEYNNRYSFNKCISQFTLKGVYIRDWDAISTASKELNINCSNISQCCLGKRKSAGGYVWKYKEVK